MFVYAQKIALILVENEYWTSPEPEYGVLTQDTKYCSYCLCAA